MRRLLPVAAATLFGSVLAVTVTGVRGEMPAPEPMMIVFGPAAPSREGDADRMERIYVGLPESADGSFQLMVFDPDAGSAYDSLNGQPDTPVVYRVFGGPGAFTGPDRPVTPEALTRTGTVDPLNDADAPGRLLSERRFDPGGEGDGAWVSVARLDPAAGERAEGRIWFRLDVAGEAGNDGNAFSVDVLRDAVEDTPAEGIVIRSYAPSIRWPRSGDPVAVRLKAPADGQFTVRNFDAAKGTLQVVSDFEDLPLTASGQNAWAADDVDAYDRILSLTLRDGEEIPNDVTLVAIGADGKALPLELPPFRAAPVDRPTPVAEARPLSSCTAVAFDASRSSGAKEFGFRWEFGDGASSDQPVVIHDYAQPGRYEAVLSILDTRSQTPRGARLRLPVHVRPAPIASAGAAITVAPGEAVAFDAAGSTASDSPITRHRWSFGDGTEAEGSGVTKAYGQPGRYQVVLRVEDDSDHPCNFGLSTRTVTVNHPPVAEAGPDRSAAIGGSLSFDAGASYDKDGRIVSYRWSFGDGAEADGPKAEHAFSAPGTYSVTLTVTDDSGVANAAATDTMTVTVNAPPLPVASGPARPIAIGEVATLSADGTADPDGAILTYRWDFADGTVAEGPTVAYAWEKAGRYPVTLTVTDDSGTSSAESRTTVDVVVSAAPVAVAGPDQYLTASVAQFDGRGSADPDGRIASYEWDFGDGSTAVGPAVEHAYRAPGTYEVTLVVRDDSGAPLNVARDFSFVTINALPVADAGPDLIVAPGQEFFLDGSGSVDPDGTIGDYAWRFAGGGEARGAQITHRFDAPGVYPVALTVSDSFGGGPASDTDELLVRVNAPPVAVIGPDLLVEPGQPVVFSGANSYDPDGAIGEWRWDFDDLADPVAGSTVERVFDKPGVVTAQLTVVDTSGAINATDRTDVTIRVNHGPVAEAGADVSTDRLYVDLDASGSADADGDALIYRWDFGDGSAPVEGRKVRHFFPRSGSFPVTLVVDDGTGLGNARATDALVVTIDAPPLAVAGGNRDVCSGDAILFDGSASADPDGERLRYRWDFGDGSGSDLVNPSKTYERPGVYPVTLTVRDESGSERGVDSDRIAAIVREGPIADAGADLKACTNQTVRFDGSGSSDADGAVNAYSWAFGDGGSANGERPTHVFKDPGSYAVTLTITGDAAGQCSALDTDQMTVVVEAAPELVIASDRRIAAGADGRYEAVISGAEARSATNIRWDFGDGATAEGAAVSHAYTAPGDYTVRVSAEIEGAATGCGLLKAERRVTVNAAPQPVIDGPEQVAVGEAVVFDASRSVDPDGAVTAYAWDFGDGTTGSGVTVSHVFAAAGPHAVRLTVTDDAGVANSAVPVTLAVAVNPAPVAGLKTPPPLCAGVPQAFDAPVGETVAVRWQFGDGTTGEGRSVSHAFREPGLYPVVATLDDGKGLPNSRREEEVSVRVNRPPVAVAGPDRLVCPGETVVFDGSASGDMDGRIASWLWTFPDGETLTGSRVERSFSTPGIASVRLAVTDDSGALCSVGEDTVAVAVNAAPVVDAGPDLEIPVGAAHDVVTFDASGASDPDGQGLAITWSFGDGTEASGARVTHRYAEPGSYTVTVTARDPTGLSCGVATDTATVTAVARP